VINMSEGREGVINMSEGREGGCDQYVSRVEGCDQICCLFSCFKVSKHIIFSISANLLSCSLNFTECEFMVISYVISF